MKSCIVVLGVSFVLLQARVGLSTEEAAPQPGSGEQASGEAASSQPASSEPVSAPSGAPAEAPATAVVDQRPVEDTASPELVGSLVKDLAITPSQAEGAAGALFGVAKRRLAPAEFAKVEAAVPNMDGLLKAAPPKDVKASALALAASSVGGGGAAGLASSFAALGLKPETIVKLAPALVKAVEARGGAEVAGLLAGALK
jgi:hypothetical protein